MASLPSLQDARAWVKVPDTVVDNGELQQMLDAATEHVVKRCRGPVTADGIPDLGSTAWPTGLRQAVLRRIQRTIASKNLPLGFLDSSSEYGPARIPLYDALIEQDEGPYRKAVV